MKTYILVKVGESIAEALYDLQSEEEDWHVFTVLDEAKANQAWKRSCGHECWIAEVTLSQVNS